MSGMFATEVFFTLAIFFQRETAARKQAEEVRRRADVANSEAQEKAKSASSSKAY
jgi:hypothetical protein